MIARFAASATATFLGAVPCGAAPAVSASCDAPVALHFAPGSSSGEASGGIARGDLACWTLSAKEGQVLTATVGSTGQNAIMQIYQPGWKVSKTDGDYHFAGAALKGVAEGDDGTNWTGALTRTGPFLFVLGTTSAGGDYKLHVVVRSRGR